MPGGGAQAGWNAASGAGAPIFSTGRSPFGAIESINVSAFGSESARAFAENVTESREGAERGQLTFRHVERRDRISCHPCLRRELGRSPTRRLEHIF